MTEVRDIAMQLASVMTTDSGVRRVNYDWMEPGRMVRISIDQDEARLLGLSSQTLAGVLNTVVTARL